jgi:predicted DNA-binding protein with PD1-like motif
MRYSEASLGRVFVLQLEDGEPLNRTVETFARSKMIGRGVAFYVGGGAGGTDLVVGPDAEQRDIIVPLIHTLVAPHETFAVGTLFPDEAGDPVLHMHAGCGREGGATVGCTRAGLETWLTGELVLIELIGTNAARLRDPSTGFQLLDLE